MRRGGWGRILLWEKLMLADDEEIQIGTRGGLESNDFKSASSGQRVAVPGGEWKESVSAPMQKLIAGRVYQYNSL
jgi:hypothetical protein